MATTTPTKSPKSSNRKSTSAGPRRAANAAKASKASADMGAVDLAPDAVETAEITTLKPAKASRPAKASKSAKEARHADDLSEGASGDDDAASDDRISRGDLIGAIAARVSLKRSEAKMVFDVVLDEIGKALDGSDEIVVPPLGKLMVKKRDVKQGGAMLTLKLKRSDAAPVSGDAAADATGDAMGDGAPLADADEDS